VKAISSKILRAWETESFIDSETGLLDWLRSNYFITASLQACFLRLASHNFALIACLKLLPNASLIKLLPTLGQLFFGITSLSHGHWLALVSTLLSHFS
jgi:hypothetical protein